MADVRNEKLSSIFGLHTAWHEAPAGDDKMRAWEMLMDELDPRMIDSVLWLARGAFRQNQRHASLSAALGNDPIEAAPGEDE